MFSRYQDIFISCRDVVNVSGSVSFQNNNNALFDCYEIFVLVSNGEGI